jgi:hypothetical protein
MEPLLLDSGTRRPLAAANQPPEQTSAGMKPAADPLSFTQYHTRCGLQPLHC